MTDEELGNLYEQVDSLMEQQRLEDAAALCRMAIEQCPQAARPRARDKYARILTEITESFRGQDPFEAQAKNNLQLVKQQVQQGLNENPDVWSIQANAVMAARSLLVVQMPDLPPPRSTGEARAKRDIEAKIRKEMQDSAAMVAQELATLVRLGKESMERRGKLAVGEFLPAGQLALQIVADIRAYQPAVAMSVYEFFSQQDESIAYQEESADGWGMIIPEEEARAEVGNIRRLAEAQRQQQAATPTAASAGGGCLILLISPCLVIVVALLTVGIKRARSLEDRPRDRQTSKPGFRR